jgi:hypothetical protein
LLILLNQKQLNQFYFLSYLLVFAGLLVYVSYKAFNCDITNDEAYSFRLVHTGNFRAMAGTANTHWLNSIAIYIFNNLFGLSGTGAFRMLSIVGFIVYAYAIYRFSRTYKHISLSFGALVILLLNPFLLDYFSMARGYGLAVGLETLGLFYFLRACHTKASGCMLKAFLIMATAVAANYCAFYIFFCTALFYLILLRKDGELFSAMKKKNALIILFAIIGVVSLISIVNLALIKNAGDLQYGSNNSFFQTTGSLIVFSTYGIMNHSIAMTISKFVTVFSLALAAYKVYRNISRKNCSPEYGLGFIIVVSFLIFEALHFIARTPFLYGRTALVLVPVYVLFLLYVADNINSGKMRKIIAVGCYTICLFVLLNFINAANLHFFYEWRGSADAGNHLRDINLNAEQKKLPDRPVVFIYRDYSIFINYYSLVKPMDYRFDLFPGNGGGILKDDYIFTITDYAILPIDYWQKHKDGQMLKYRLLKSYTVSKTVLVERLH